jgi:hypothetical protein
MTLSNRSCARSWNGAGCIRNANKKMNLVEFGHVV